LDFSSAFDLNIENANKVADNNLKQTKQQIQKYIVSVVTKRLCAITSYQLALAVPITSTQYLDHTCTLVLFAVTMSQHFSLGRL